MDLQALSELGLPGWLVIIAASLFILKQVGLLDFFINYLADKREHSQATENIAIDALREIIRESVQEQSKDITELDKTVYRLGRQIDNLAHSVRILASEKSK